MQKMGERWPSLETNLSHMNYVLLIFLFYFLEHLFVFHIIKEKIKGRKIIQESKLYSNLKYKLSFKIHLFPSLMIELWSLLLLCTHYLHVKCFLRILYWLHCSHQAINLGGSLTICEMTRRSEMYRHQIKMEPGSNDVNKLINSLLLI